MTLGDDYLVCVLASLDPEVGGVTLKCECQWRCIVGEQLEHTAGQYRELPVSFARAKEHSVEHHPGVPFVYFIARDASQEIVNEGRVAI